MSRKEKGLNYRELFDVNLYPSRRITCRVKSRNSLSRWLSTFWYANRSPPPYYCWSEAKTYVNPYEAWCWYTDVSGIWRSWYRASLMYSFKYNQQDAALHNIPYCCQCSTCFRRVFRPSSGAQTVHTASGVCQACLLPTASVGKLAVPTHRR